MVPVEILGMQLDHDIGASVVLLGESNEITRVLPIFIGPAEATAIAIGLADVSPPRPGTHDLLLDVMAASGSRLLAVEVVGLEHGTFLAELEVETPAGVRRIDSRPSDAIALAVRLDVPIMAAVDVLDEAAVVVEPEDASLSEEEIERAVAEFHSFLESAEPADFEGSPDVEEPPDATHVDEPDNEEE